MTRGAPDSQREIGNASERNRAASLVDFRFPMATTTDTHDPETKNGRSRARRRRGGGNAGRLLGILALLPLAGRAPLYARLIWALILDDRVPASRKAILAGAFGYVLLGRDIVPDEIPLIGGLDDLVVVAIAVDLFLDGVDDGVLAEKLVLMGIPRSAYEEDVARIRKMLPGPVRRTIRRIPEALEVAGQAVNQANIGPRVRSLFERQTEAAQPDTEESPA
jgi:uncharacterized membrane protein YkvA (DUF1232 family)